MIRTIVLDELDMSFLRANRPVYGRIGDTRYMICTEECYETVDTFLNKLINCKEEDIESKEE